MITIVVVVVVVDDEVANPSASEARTSGDKLAIGEKSQPLEMEDETVV